MDETVAARALLEDRKGLMSDAAPENTTGSAPDKAAAAPPVRRRRQRRAEDTREKIIAAAASGFAKHGYDGLSTRSLSEEAGVQHTLITYHFGSKEGLWQAVLSHQMERFSRRIDERLRGLSKVDDTTKLRLLFEEFIRLSALNPEHHALMSQAAAKPDTRLQTLVDSTVRANFESWVSLIRSAQKAGRFVEGDPQVLYYVFLGAATRIYMVAGEVEQVTGQSPFTLDWVEKHIATVLRLFFIDPD